MYKCSACVSVFLTHTFFYMRRICVLHSRAHWPRQQQMVCCTLIYDRIAGGGLPFPSLFPPE